MEASQIKSVIKKNDISCWMAPQSISAGSDYSSEIPTAIKNCEVFVLVLLGASQESAWVPKELDRAILYKKPIIPFHIDNSDIIDSFDFQLSNVQRIEAYEKTASSYELLVDRLRALCDIERK